MRQASYAGRRFANAPKDDPLTTRMDARIGVRGNVAVRRLANTVTFCDGHGVFFVASQLEAESVTHRETLGSLASN